VSASTVFWLVVTLVFTFASGFFAGVLHELHRRERTRLEVDNWLERVRGRR